MHKDDMEGDYAKLGTQHHGIKVYYDTGLIQRLQRRVASVGNPSPTLVPIRQCTTHR
jgi:hypothetical protein